MIRGAISLSYSKWLIPCHAIPDQHCYPLFQENGWLIVFSVCLLFFYVSSSLCIGMKKIILAMDSIWLKP
uniref:Uncharacterized protein n=1 Tax=Arundo donax TaxID=35708 RepID=A0A0A9FCP7_ARUDO